MQTRNYYQTTPREILLRLFAFVWIAYTLCQPDLARKERIPARFGIIPNKISLSESPLEPFMRVFSQETMILCN